MYIHVLDQNPKLSAGFFADVHIGPTITACAKMLSTAIQELAPDKIVTIPQLGGKMERRYKTQDGVILMPPIKEETFRPWIDWLKEEYQRAWWVVTLAWFLDRELTTRFGPSVGGHPDNARLNQWAQAGLIGDVFTKRLLGVRDFPIVLPRQLPLTSKDPIDVYRGHYAVLQTYHKMKWSGPRTKPDWLGGPKKNVQTTIPLTCSKCGSDAGGDLCGVTECPMKGGIPF